MFMENLPKKGPLPREFWAQKPTHMGGTYPYPQHVMYPPPREIDPTGHLEVKVCRSILVQTVVATVMFLYQGILYVQRPSG